MCGRGGTLVRSRVAKRITSSITAMSLCFASSVVVLFGFLSPVQAESFPDAGFEDGTFTGWDKGSQSGTLGNTITGNGSGVTIFTGSRTFTHGSRGAVGNSSSPYYAPAVASGSWTFSPNNGTNAVLLQPKGEQTFDQAASALNLSAGSVTEIKNMLTSQAQASGNGQGTPTDAAWITREVALTAGTTYTMAWNYVGTDYVPYNDGSITSLVPVTVTGTPVVTVNNYVKQYALLGFTNPGTGDYSTNSYSATGWQTSTYQVSISGTYELGFASFNLDDTGLPPALMIDSEAGSTERCISGTCTTFGGVASNSETAPTVPPTTTTTVASTTTTSSTTTTTTTTIPSTTTTTLAPYLNPVTNLTAVANADGSVDLDWDASAASNCVIYGYSVNFYDLTVIGGATSGGWGVWTNQGTNYSLSTGMFSGSNPVTTGYGPVRFGIKAMTAGCAGVGTGSCTYGPEVTIDATVLDPTTSTTTTSTTVAPVVVIPPGDTTVPLPQYPEPETESTTVTLPVEIEPGTELPTETIPEYSEPIEIDPTETETVVVIIPPDDYTVTDIEDNEPITTVILDNILDDTFTTGVDADEVGAVLDTLLGAELTDTQFDNVLEAVFTEYVSTEVFTEALTTMLDADITSEQLNAVLDSAFSEDTSPENMVSALTSIFDGPVSSGDLDTVMNAVFDEDISVADTMTVLEDLLETNLSGSEAEAVFDSVFDGDLSDAETIDLIVDVLEGELTAELLGSVLGAVFDESVSTEVLIETFTAVLDGELNAESVGVIVDVLDSETITNDQVSQVVDLIVSQDGGVDSEQATELATSAKVLESIDGEQATAVFAAVVVSEVSQEAGAAISEALTEAGTDVKESFEEEINVFAGVFDTYVALGSSIDVGTRRSVIAVNLVASTVALASAAGAMPTPGPSAPPAPRQDVAARKEEEETEEGGAIEGEGPDWIKQISIYKYEDGVRVMDWKNFTRKFIYGVMASGFTLAGATVMYFTLSGFTQKIALWGTVLAFTASMYLHMKEPDEG